MNGRENRRGDRARRDPRRYYGVYAAQVIDNMDPEGLGRVRVRVKALQDEAGAESPWARLATLMAGDNRGSWFIPEVGDEVLLSFEAGDPRRPYVVGALWNGRDEPPESMDAGNSIKSLRSRGGVKLTFDDSDGHEQLVVETPGGRVVRLEDGPGRIEISDGNGSRVTLEPSGITLSTPAAVRVEGSMVRVSASHVQVDAAMSSFSGVVQADTLIANSVVASSYTPGAGNLW